MAKAIGISAYSTPASDRSGNKSTAAEKIGIYDHADSVNLQFFIPHGLSKYGEKSTPKFL